MKNVYHVITVEDTPPNRKCHELEASSKEEAKAKVAKIMPCTTSIVSVVELYPVYPNAE